MGQKTKDYSKELNDIYNFINNYFRIDIADKNRSNHYVDLRTLYYKIATDTTHATTKDIGAVVNRDHSTVVHARKYYFDYVMSMKDTKECYRSYFGFENPIEASEAIIVDNDKDTVGLTENEIAYRKLSIDDKKKYDERASLILKSFKWKEHNSSFETINVGISSN